MGKKKTIENCVGTVTVSTRIQNGAVTTTYQFKAGFAAHGWTDKRAKDVVRQMKSGVKNMSDEFQFRFCVLVGMVMGASGLTGQGRHTSIPACFPEVDI